MGQGGLWRRGNFVTRAFAWNAATDLVPTISPPPTCRQPAPTIHFFPTVLRSSSPTATYNYDCPNRGNHGAHNAKGESVRKNSICDGERSWAGRRTHGTTMCTEALLAWTVGELKAGVCSNLVKGPRTTLCSLLCTTYSYTLSVRRTIADIYFLRPL